MMSDDRLARENEVLDKGSCLRTTQARRFPIIRRTADSTVSADRMIAVEAPVAIEVNGLGYAVMMATPEDLIDFGTGFAITERLVGSCDEIVEVTSHETDKGWLLRIWVEDHCLSAIRDRMRHRVADSGCGLCGLENLEQALRPLPAIGDLPTARPTGIFRALAGLQDHQIVSQATGAVHAAALCDDDGAILIAREDVGRHNSFDKLIGAAALNGLPMNKGFVLLSSRCSYELVEKAAVSGVPLLVTISAPTSLAVERSRDCGLTLVSLARPDAILIMNDPHNLLTDWSDSRAVSSDR